MASRTILLINITAAASVSLQVSAKVCSAIPCPGGGAHYWWSGEYCEQIETCDILSIPDAGHVLMNYSTARSPKRIVLFSIDVFGSGPGDHIDCDPQTNIRPQSVDLARKIFDAGFTMSLPRLAAPPAPGAPPTGVVKGHAMFHTPSGQSIGNVLQDIGAYCPAGERRNLHDMQSPP